MTSRARPTHNAVLSPQPAPAGGLLLQRKCACGKSAGLSGECQECGGGKLLQRRAAEAAPAVAPPIVHEVLRSAGEPLDGATRALMETRLGHDFSKVRVHTDAPAAESARAVNALAYTVGRDVVFAAGQYDPSAERGRRLLAHELTHTIQQSASASAAVATHDHITIEPAGTALERAAEQNADHAAPGPRALSPAPAVTLQRQPDDKPAEPELDLDYRRSADKEYAWKHGRKDVDRINKKGQLTPEHKREIITKLRFFKGAAKKAYIQFVSNTLVEYASEDVGEILEESAKPETGGGEEAPKHTCDITQGLYLLEYEEDPGKARCIDDSKDREFKAKYFDYNIARAIGYAVEGTTWENVEYESFKVMLVKYKNNTSEYFMLNEIGEFVYGTNIIREHTYLMRKTGLIYPIHSGRLYLKDLVTPNIVAYKNGLKHQVKELQDLYTLLETAGAFASIMGAYGAASGSPSVQFRSSLQGFRRVRSTRVTTPDAPPRTKTDDPSVSPTSTTTMKLPKPPPTKTAKPPAKPPGKHEGEEARTTVVSRTDDDPTGAKGGKKLPAKKTEKSQQVKKPAKAGSKKGDEPEDPKGSKQGQTADQPQTASRMGTLSGDPQQGVTAALGRANQRIAERRAEIEGYNKQISKARENEFSLRKQRNETPQDDPKHEQIVKDHKKTEKRLAELTAQREVPIRQLQEDQATAIRLKKALDAKTYERPTSFRAGVEDAVWKNALAEGNGKVLSPSGKEINPGDPWVMGHKPKYEFWKHQRSAAERGITREQFIKEHNDARRYRPETPQDNASHKYEDRTDAYLGS